MNWKKIATYLVVFGSGIVFGSVLIWYSTTKTAKTMIEAQKETIHKAIDKESIKNEIKNEIQIDKVKKSEGIEITLKPENNQKPTNVINKESTTDCELTTSQYEKFSNSRKRKFKRWLEELDLVQY